MKFLIRTLLSLMIATAAKGATVVPVADLICTRDFNAWGQASICGCPSELHYDKRVGACLAGEAESATVRGEIATEVMAIGGETIGLLLTSPDEGTFELIVPLYLKRQLNQAELKGIEFQVTGDLVNLSAVGSEERPSLVVTDIIYAD